MTSRYVVDASVALKWCLPAPQESLVEQAEELLESYRLNEVHLLVPDLFWPEVGSALWKAVWRGRIDRSAAEKSLTQIQNLGLLTIPCSEYALDALQLAIGYGRTAYDCHYVALAAKSQAALITADERLANAMAARFPVKWLGAM